MRIYLYLLFFALSFVTFGQGAYAQDSQSGGDAAQIDSGKLDDLIQTLESEAARKEFIDNLSIVDAAFNIGITDLKDKI